MNVVKTIKTECLDRMNFFGEASLPHATTGRRWR